MWKIVKLKISYICYKTFLLSSICNKCRSEDEKIFMEQVSINILKMIGLTNNIEEYHTWKKNEPRI